MIKGPKPEPISEYINKDNTCFSLASEPIGFKGQETLPWLGGLDGENVVSATPRFWDQSLVRAHTRSD